MLSLALRMIRARRSGFVAAFVAVFFGSALITASGVLLDSGLRGGIAPERYASAPVVVTAPQDVSTLEQTRYGERVSLPAGDLAALQGVPGVRSAIGDVTVKAGLRAGAGTTPLPLHGWSSAQLGAGTLTGGRAPEAPGEVVLAGGVARIGDTVELSIGAVGTPYRVVGTTSGTQLSGFVTDAQAQDLAGRPGRVDAIAVLTDPGVSADEVAGRVAQALPGVVTSTGDDRGSAESLDSGAGRTFLVTLAGAFGGTMMMIVLLVVASTLGLSMQQRRREFALLRAIAAQPRQIRRLIASETALVSAVAAVLGALPGIGLAQYLRDALAGYGSIPEGFRFVVGPLPVLAAVAACVVSSVLAGLVVARRAARISPVAALGEAAVEPKKLGRGRLLTGWLLAAAGTVAGVVVPGTVSGTAAAGSAAGSALLLVIAVAFLGPVLLTTTAKVLGRLGLRRTPSGFLAGANAHARSRRLGSATTPLIMGVALAAVQIFMVTTTNAAAREQSQDGLRADTVLIGQSGLAPSIADRLAGTPGVTAIPVARTQVLVTYQFAGDPETETYTAQGITGAGADRVLDLGVREGALAGLTAGTVALSKFSADTFGVGVGGRISMKLGDGTPYDARVVALYDRGLGYGDVTLPEPVVTAHTTTGLDDEILVSGDRSAVRAALAGYPEVQVTDRASFTAAQSDALEGQSAVNLLLNLVLLAFIAIAVVNILVLATAARVREFALLRLVGAKPRQVRAMMRGEALMIVGAAVVLGSVAALPPLAGLSLALTGSPVPTVPPLVYLAIVAAAVVFGWTSIALPTRVALRPKPVEAIRVGE